jgi:hypothetical protein
MAIIAYTMRDVSGKYDGDASKTSPLFEIACLLVRFQVYESRATASPDGSG